MIDAAALADARFALAAAARDCTPGRCDWYHGPWSVLRALGLAMTPARQLAFYRQALADVAPGSSILVSGSADHGMLALVAEQLSCDATTCHFTVVDLCATPLALCRRHAGTRGLALVTEVGDILGFEPTGRFDVVVSHAFLGYFSAEQRQRLFARWHALLRPGGLVVTVQRLRPGFVGDQVGFSPAEKRGFVEAALARREDAATLGLDRDALQSLAEVYADHFLTHPIRGYDEIAVPMGEAGFALAPRSSMRPPPAATGAAGPSLAGDADFACIVAVKRGD